MLANKQRTVSSKRQLSQKNQKSFHQSENCFLKKRAVLKKTKTISSRHDLSQKNKNSKTEKSKKDWELS